MCAAVDSDVNKKKVKQKSVLFGYCSDMLNKIVSSSNKSTLKTDAVPLDNGSMQVTSNGTESIDRNTTQNLSISPRNVMHEHTHPMQMIQNNLNQANQNVTVIESQQNLSFNNINGLQIGNTFHMSGSSPRKNSCNGRIEEKSIGNKTKSLIGKRFFLLFWLIKENEPEHSNEVVSY